MVHRFRCDKVAYHTFCAALCDHAVSVDVRYGFYRSSCISMNHLRWLTASSTYGYKAAHWDGRRELITEEPILFWCFGDHPREEATVLSVIDAAVSQQFISRLVEVRNHSRLIPVLTNALYLFV